MTCIHLTARKVAVGTFFAVYLLVGVAIVDHYGASWDELFNHSLGARNYGYAVEKLSGGSTPASRTFAVDIAEQGAFFEVVLFAIEEIFSLDEPRAIFRMRHMVTFLAFWSGTLAFYLLLRLRFANRAVAILGTLFLILTPRIFAHSFYNSKDTVLLALFVISTYTMLRFLREQTLSNAALHALACAAAIDTRIIGLILPALTLLFLGIGCAEERLGREGLKKLSFSCGIYLLLLLPLVVLFWPQLWETPWKSLVLMTAKLDDPAQSANNFAFYLGRFVEVNQLPWHYLPVWMFITIPFGYTLLFLAGVWITVRGLRRGSPAHVESKWNLLPVLLLLLPILAVILMRPVLYDGWRHFYFIYPAFLMIALLPVHESLSRQALRVPALLLLAALIAHSTYSIVRDHPYQSVYFNFWAGENREDRYELDYWGISFREGLEFLLEREPEGLLAIHVSDYPGRVNSVLLEPEERERLRYVELDAADYFLSNHRQPAEYALFKSGQFPYTNEVYSIVVGGAKILGVYQHR